MSTSQRRRRVASGAATTGGAGAAADRRSADAGPSSGQLEVGEADRRLDALIEEEVQRRARSVDSGMRIASVSTGNGARGPPVSFAPALPQVRETQREISSTAAAGSAPVQRQGGHGGDGVTPYASQAGVGNNVINLGALQEAFQRSYQALHDALGRGHGGQGLLGPLDPSNAPALQGGFLSGAIPETGGQGGGMAPRTLEYGSAAAQTPSRRDDPPVNPFWSPAVRDAASRASAVGDGGGHGHEGQRRDQDPPSSRQVEVRQTPSSDPRPRDVAQSPTPQDEIEVLRLRILKDAQEQFEKEVRRLTGGRDSGDSVSFKTASSGNPEPGPRGAPECPPGLGQPAEPSREPPDDRVLSTPHKVMRIGDSATQASLTEALRNLELPALPLPHTDGASIVFGDWLTMVFPLMADISCSAKSWWQESLMAAQECYARWLTLSPLERLRAKPEIVVATAFQRIEQRGVAMLLAALPDQLRRDLVSARNLSVVQILYKLHVTYQPGGGAEKTQLLKNLVETKFPAGLHDLLTQVRLWRRWLSRAEELRVSLPDPIVLMVTVQRMIDGVAKLGGAQVAFRIANVRQELKVDYLATMESVQELAEYVQAELEEMALTSGPKAAAATTSSSSAQASGANSQPVQAALKAFQQSGSSGDGEGKGDGKLPCKFWKSEDGCRRGSSCTFGHDTNDMKGRCFGCGSTQHIKKECPHKPKSDTKNDGKKISKVKGGKESTKTDGPKSERSSPEKEDSQEALQSKTTASSSAEGAPSAPTGRNATADLLNEATTLLKSLRAMKAIRIKELTVYADLKEKPVALIDGGATHGLRRAKPSELDRLQPVQVELAAGSATLYRVPEHSTLLSMEPVEAIVPLHRLVSLGYSLTWTSAGVKIFHPVDGRITCALRNGCPVMTEAEALKLLDRMEVDDAGIGDGDGGFLQWWKERFPNVPESVIKYMKGQSTWDASSCPWNRRQRRRHQLARGVIIHLFSGKDAKKWTKESWGDFEVITVDVSQGAQYDLHAAGVWGYLCHLARQGKVVGVIGGPPCRSVSRLRHRDPGPRPVRGRNERRFGLPNLLSYEVDLVEGDTALMLKQIGLWMMASEANTCSTPPAFLMESPRDPWDYCQEEAERHDMPSFWNFEEVQRAAEVMNADYVILDQGPLGHVRRKPTCLMIANMPGMMDLHGIAGEGLGEVSPTSLSARISQSREWSAWADGLVRAIKVSLKIYLENLPKIHSCEVPAEVKKLNAEDWKQHVLNQHQPYRRDCRKCLELMGVDAPHRRSNGDRSAYCLSLDILGPLPEGDDVGLGVKAKYIMVGTVPLPRVSREVPGMDDYCPTEPEGPSSEDVQRDQPLPALDDAEPEEPPDDRVAALNQRWEEYAKDLSSPVGVQNVTVVEPLESRGQHDVAKVAVKLYSRFRALGIRMIRVHTDRESAFLSRTFQQVWRHFGLYQTMTGGDEGPSNGRIEAEVQQVKRRLRLLLRESGLDPSLWPGVARYVGEERLRQQCRKLGVPQTPLLPIGSKVTVKTKRWHRAGFGPLIPPFRTMQILGPSPFMSTGYVLRDGSQVQHARLAVRTDPLADRAVLELQEVENPGRPSRRLTGKQPADPDVVPIPLPLQHPDPTIQKVECRAGGEHNAAPGSGGEPPHVYPKVPALPEHRAGGESFGCGMNGSGEDRGGNPDEGANCRGCGLQVCQNPLPTRWEDEKIVCPEIQCRVCEEPVGSVRNLVMNGRVECTLADGIKLKKLLGDELWGWKQHWSRSSRHLVSGEEEGRLQGCAMDYLEAVVAAYEEDLLQLHDYEERYQVASMCLKSMPGEVSTMTEAAPEGVHAVLQTYTVPLAQVRKDLDAWIPSLKKEMDSLLVTTKAVRSVKVSDLEKEPGYDEMLVVPSKLVPTVKAPDGRKKSRIVLCGNLLEDTSKRTSPDPQDPQADKSSAKSFELYASGIDGASLRCALRKAAFENWEIGVTDVSTAFLLAPRKSSRLMVTKPPSVLLDAGLVDKDDRWIVEAAVYGLDTSPADWQSYRDNALSSMRWWTSGWHFWIVATPEPNVWRVMGVEGSEHEQVDALEAGAPVGYALSYVDDFIVMGEKLAASSFLDRLSTMWRCSKPAWVDRESWLKFCGMQLRWSDQGLLLGQPDYAKEVVSRHPEAQPKPSPLPKLDDDLVEDDISPEDVRACQVVIGELLWLSTRTRPDLSFAVAYLGSRVTKCPRRVLKLAEHTVGYLHATTDLALVYSPPKEKVDDFGRRDSLSRLEVASDASFAPGGGRGHQGLLAFWAGGLVSWESKAQPFATLSTTESELLGYVDALSMGESVGAIVNVLELNALERDGSYILKGDNLSGLQLLQAPSGPWRTRHLRLRSHVLRERIANKLWSIEHVPGSELCADLLTKSIVLGRPWNDFFRVTGLQRSESGELGRSVGLTKLRMSALAAVGALGIALAVPTLSTAAKVASTVAIAALSVAVARMCEKEKSQESKIGKMPKSRN